MQLILERMFVFGQHRPSPLLRPYRQPELMPPNLFPQQRIASNELLLAQLSLPSNPIWLQ